MYSEICIWYKTDDGKMHTTKSIMRHSKPLGKYDASKICSSILRFNGIEDDITDYGIKGWTGI